jgi:hypothetical protein
MTPADAPNPSDGPLAATKPPDDLAVQPTGNASRTRVSRHWHRADPPRIPLSLLAPRSLALLARSKAQAAIAGAIRSP